MMSTRILANLTCLQIANIDVWSLDDETKFYCLRKYLSGRWTGEHLSGEVWYLLITLIWITQYNWGPGAHVTMSGDKK